MTSRNELTVHLPVLHTAQAAFVRSTAPRIMVRAGRRGGKTFGEADRGVEAFLKGRRVLYATPTQDQIEAFWWLVCKMLREPIEAGVLYKNETKHIIELPGTQQRIRAKTAWNADTLRGDYADELILDEFQLMNEDTWGLVGAPMLLDNGGNASFIYTPLSLASRTATKALDPQHAAKMFKKAREAEKLAAEEGVISRWATYTFRSYDNPYINQQAIKDLAADMSALAYRMEIEAEDVDEAPGALWKRAHIEAGRVTKTPETLDRVVVGLDPSATSHGDEAGIITAGCKGDQLYVLADNTIQGSPRVWASAAIAAYYHWQADCIIAEDNNGGEMVEMTINTVDPRVPVRRVHASRGKVTRAQPVSALYEPKDGLMGRGHHVGVFTKLEDEMCLWTPGEPSPNRMDALVWAATDLMFGLSKLVAVSQPYS